MAARLVLWTAVVVAVAAVATAAFLVFGHGGGGFGHGGKATTPRTGASYEFASALVLQPDGKLVVAGCHCPPPGQDSSLELARFGENGRLDPSFGSDGTVRAAIGAGAGTWALVRQRDGKLVAAASSGKGSHSRFALTRYDQNGRLDASFGTGGVVTTAIGKSSAAEALLLQPDGKLVAAGSSGKGAESRFAVARYDEDGRLDGSFGNGGTVTTAIGNGAAALAVLLQPDGKLVVAGSSGSGAHSMFALARYDRNGRLDRGFGDAGTVTTASWSHAVAQALLLEPDGALVAAGRGGRLHDFRFALARYDPRGRLDRSFGSGGVVTTRIGDSAGAAALVRRPDGTLVVAGSAFYGQDIYSGYDTFAVAGYDRNGRVDPGFGEGGTATTAIGKQSGAAALVLLPDGRLVAAGYSGDGRNFTFALARYESDGGLDR